MSLEVVRGLARAALRNLEAHRQRIDDLNVYPVPDGDTGTNLALTVRAVVEALDASTATAGAAIAKEATRAALMGARGNSGVILSQIVRGFAEVLGSSEEVSTSELRRAFRSASDAAYRAVRRPVEGTMLTVIREMAEEAERRENRTVSAEELLRRVLARGEDALARTPELLDVLREAGVVDAGGAGLVEIVRGALLELTGEPLPEVPVEAPALPVEAIHLEPSRYRYCTVFVVEGQGLDRERLEAELERLGDSLLVVGDASALKVHVHTDDPGAALSAGVALGVIEGVEIANMHAQTAEREERLVAPRVVSEAETGVVVVCPGEGNRRLFESLGASRVIEGGQTVNPSTAEILAAIEAVPAKAVLVLPNNPNVLLSAEQAAAHATREVRVVPSRSVQAGLVAMARYVPTSSVEENEREMLDALDSVATGEIAVASRDATVDGVATRKGAYLGLVDGVAVASSERFEEVADAVLDRLLEGERETLVVLVGEAAPPLHELLERVRAERPSLAVELHEGGQPHYPLLLAAE